MILVDTSVWIDALNGRLGTKISEKELIQFRSCGPVLQEVLQGLRDDASSASFRQDFLALPLLGNPLGRQTFMLAAEIFRNGRRKGYTIRSSIDCLIAAIAIENDALIWHRDRDFDTISIYTNLRSTQRI